MKFFQHGGGRHLGYVRTVNSAVRSAVPENPTLEPNMKWIGSPVAEIWPFAYVVGIWNPPPILGEGKVVGASDGTIRKSYGSFIWAYNCDRCAICNHSAEICDRMSPTLKSTGGGGHFGPQFPGVPLGVDPESEHPRLTNGELI